MTAEKPLPKIEHIERIPNAWVRLVEALKRITKHRWVGDPTGYGRKRRRRPRKRRGLVVGAIVVSGLSAPAHADLSQFLFGLGGDNTAYDYMSAPISRSVEFIMNLCNGGVCLNESDWRCGFENNDDLTKVEDCFSSLVVKVPPWVKLDLIRKFCGVSFARFTGVKGSVANPQRCAQAGGAWGVKSKVSVPGFGR